MPFLIETNNGVGFSTIDSILNGPNGLVNALTTGGGNASFSGSEPFRLIDSDASTVILEAYGIDPLWADSTLEAPNDAPAGFDGNQNWRIALVIDASNNLVMYWGSKQQIGGEDDSIENIDSITPHTKLIDASAIGAQSANFPKDKFTWNYMLSTTDRGFALAVYASGQENQMINDATGLENAKVICIQRPTNTINGSIKSTGRAPVFAVYSDIIAPNEINSWSEQAELPNADIPGFKFSVVRDDTTPFSSEGVPMNVVSDKVRYTFDFEWHQPPMLDNYNHVIKFPIGLSTIRHIYLEEVDMMGLVYAGIFSPGQEASINLYNPSQARTYTAGPGHVGAVPLYVRTSSTGVLPTNKFKNTDFWSRVVLVSDGDTVNHLNDHS